MPKRTNRTGAVTRADELTSRCRVVLPLSEKAEQQFPTLVPMNYLARIQPGRKDDPLLLQVAPLAAEQKITRGYTVDPLNEQKGQPVPGLLHKYHGRALLLVSNRCFIHCRYCFRRHYPYPGITAYQSALQAIQEDASISEVILSGGDPMTMSNRRLRDLLQRLEDMPQIRRLRIHSRCPVVSPQRIDNELLRLLRQLSRPLTFVIHANHARELDDKHVRTALRRLHQAGARLLNQAVLLRKVNDSADAQAALSEALSDAGVLPYYLHMLDPVHGTAHYRVSLRRARAIMKDLRARLPGYLVPRLVREVPGETSKRLIA